MDIYCREFAEYLENTIQEFIDAKKRSNVVDPRIEVYKDMYTGGFSGVHIVYILLGEDGKMVGVSDYSYGGSYVEFAANGSPIFVKRYEGSEKWVIDMFNEWMSTKRDEKINKIIE